jgi:hypothetical protein
MYKQASGYNEKHLEVVISILMFQSLASFDPRFDYCEEIFAFKIGAGLVVGEIHTLSGARTMDGATIAESPIG